MGKSNHNENKLEENLRLAKEAMIYAGRIIHKSCSREALDKSPQELVHDQKFQELNEDLKTLRNQQNKKISKFFSSKQPEDYGSENYCAWAKKFFNSVIHTAKHKSIGNCQEYAMLALEYCLKLPTQQVEAFYFANNSYFGYKKDHVFIVIGRDPTSDLKDIKTWGADAVVCDPWARKVYPATEKAMSENLQYISQVFNVESQLMQDTLIHFDPKKDALYRLCSLEMIQAKDFKDPAVTVDKKI